jgi:hypothetical protein
MSYITDISKSSPFFGKLQNGDELLSVNGHKIHDILDYMYHTVADDVSVCVLRDGKELNVTAKNKTGHPEYMQFLPLSDGFRIPVPLPQKPLLHPDGKSLSNDG